MTRRTSRAGRLEQVVSVLTNANRTMTTHEIVKVLGMAYSAHSRGLVYEAFRLNLIGGWQAVKPNGMEVYYWQPLSLYIHNPVQKELPL